MNGGTNRTSYGIREKDDPFDCQDYIHCDAYDAITVKDLIAVRVRIAKHAANCKQTRERNSIRTVAVF